MFQEGALGPCVWGRGANEGTCGCVGGGGGGE